MDEYKEYYYIRSPEAGKLPIGDISKQIELKNRLQCKSFKWFMEEVAYDLLTRFPVLPKNKVWGEVNLLFFSYFCEIFYSKIFWLKVFQRKNKRVFRLLWR
jgi:hypothetical protein